MGFHYKYNNPSFSAEADAETPFHEEKDKDGSYPPPKRKKKAKRRANRAALEQRRAEIDMESFQEFASTVTADYLAEMCRCVVRHLYFVSSRPVCQPLSPGTVVYIPNQTCPTVGPTILVF